jgi:hypothetical protein
MDATCPGSGTDGMKLASETAPDSGWLISLKTPVEMGDLKITDSTTALNTNNLEDLAIQFRHHRQ